MRLTERHDFSASEIDLLEEHIYEDNAAQTGHRDAAPLGFAFMSTGEMIGAIAGFTWGGFCEIRQLWVAKDHRGEGYGRALLERAIGEARARGCKRVYLSTYTFQAPGFYEHVGFTRLAEIAGKPAGQADIVMELRL
jgi:GNAT superfamily N-acetyltransferase